MRRVNGWLTVFWILMIPVSVIRRWVNKGDVRGSPLLWALVSGHRSAWQAVSVEVEQQKVAESKRKGDVPGGVDNRIVEETTMEKETGG